MPREVMEQGVPIANGARRTTPSHVSNSNAMNTQPQVNMLLSPDHFTSSVSPCGDSPYLPHEKLPGNMTGMDIPRSDFMNVVNFTAPNGSNRPMHGRLEDEDECLSQHLELETGGFEQHAAQEQASLLSRFQQLREWQSQQQTWLMRQQQEQLALLQNEQQRVQRMIAQQRNNNWGEAGTEGDVILSPGGQREAALAATKRPPRQPSSLPHAVAQGTLSHAKVNAPHRTHRPNNETTPPADGRPKPVIPDGASTPSEYCHNGNPDLDSDSVASSGAVEDGIAKLAPSMPIQPHLTTGLPPPLNLDDEDSDRENFTAVRFGNGYYGRGVMNQGGGYGDMVEGYYSEMGTQQVGVGTQWGNMGIHEGDMGTHQADVGTHQTDMGTHQADVSTHQADVETHQADMGTRRFDAGTHRVDAGTHLTDVGKYPNNLRTHQADVWTHQADVEASDDEEEFSDELSVSETEEADRVGNEFDDLPVSGIGNRKKTFEELLEEELRKEKERVQQQSDPQHRECHRPKQFLRRGEGVARFQSGPKPRKPAKKVTAKVDSHNKPQSNVKLKPQKVTVKKSATTAAQVSKDGRKRMTAVPANRLAETAPVHKSNSPHMCAARQSHDADSATGRGTIPVTHLAKTAPAMRLADSVGEISFQHCMNAREQNEKVESHELEEFELLERYADDNASFLSNASAVNRALHNHQAVRVKKASPRARNPAVVTNTHSDDTDEDVSEWSQKPMTNSSLKSQALNYETCDKGSHKKPDANVLHRKVLSSEKTKLDHLHKVEHFSDSESDVLETRTASRNHGSFVPSAAALAEESSESSESTHSHNDEPFAHYSSVPSHLQTSPQRPGHSNAKSPSESPAKSNRKICKKSSPAVNAWSGSVSPASSVSSPANGGVGGGPGTEGRDRDVWNFSDEEEWDEEEEDVEAASEDRGAMETNIAAVIKTRVSPDELPGSRIKSDPPPSSCDAPATPPTAQLVSKLFPKLRSEKPKTQLQEQQEQVLAAVRDSEVGQGVQSKALRDKLAELENEIERFRRENAAMVDLRKQREEGARLMKQEMEEFQKQKEAEMASLREHRATEMKKLKKERRVFEQSQKAAKAGPDKKERQEIESLKSKVSQLEEEMKRKDQRWTASSSRLRDRINALETENKELREEIQLLEKRRLETWQQRELVKKPELRKPPQQPPAPNPTSPPASSPPPASISTAPNPTSTPSHHKVAAPVASSHPPVQSHSRTDTQRDDVVVHSPEEKLPTQESGVPVARSQPRPQAVNHLTSPFSPRRSNASPEFAGAAAAARRSIPRKTAVAMNISRAVDMGDGQFEEMQHSDGKLERAYSNGAREILYSNGTRKQVAADNQSIIVSFFNGDVKQILPDQRVVYYYADAQTTHTTFPDGLEIIQFPNNQIEKHYPDGTKEITFADQTMKYLFPSGTEESILPDGTVIRVDTTGDKVMEFPSGQREIHTQHYKRREYPDGTVKTVYPDGRQETRYSSGRVRVKDKDGNVILDRRM